MGRFRARICVNAMVRVKIGMKVKNRVKVMCSVRMLELDLKLSIRLISVIY